MKKFGVDVKSKRVIAGLDDEYVMKRLIVGLVLF